MTLSHIDSFGFCVMVPDIKTSHNEPIYLITARLAEMKTKIQNHFAGKEEFWVAWREEEK